MTVVQPGQVVELDGQAYLVLGKTKSEYEVGSKVLVECEELVVDPASMTVGIKGLEVIGQGNGEQVDSLVGLMEEEKAYSSVIVALVPHIPIATRLAQKVKGALPIADLHVTLTHMGKARSLAQHRQAIEDILQEIASVTPPIRYKVGGHGRFLSVEDNGKEGGLSKPLDAVYASVDSPQLTDLHTKLSQALEAAGVEVSGNHGFIPHITLAYTDDKEWIPDLKPVHGVADRLVLMWAGEQKGFQLRGSVGYVRKRQTGQKSPPTLKRDSSRRGRWRTLKDGRHVRLTGGPSPKGRVGVGYGFPKVMVGDTPIYDESIELSGEEWGEFATDEGLNPEAFDGIVNDMERMPSWMREEINSVHVVPEPGEKKVISGETFRTSMQVNHKGDVTIYNANRFAEDVAQGSLSHEAGHMLYRKWGRPAAKEYATALSKHPDWHDRGELTPEGRERMRTEHPKAYYYNRMLSSIHSGLGVSNYGRAWARDGNYSETFCDMLGTATQFGERFLYAHAQEFNKGKDSSGLVDAFVGFVAAHVGDRSGSVRWSLKMLLEDTKKGRWVTIRGRPIFIAKARGTRPGPGGATSFDRDRWGAMPVGDRRDKWESLSESQRDDITDAANSIPQHQASLTSHAGARPDLEGDDVSGAIDSRINSLTVKDGQPYIPSEDAALIGSTVHDFDNVLSEAGVSPELRHKLTMEAADALVAQDRESIGRTLGDHGIHHIRGNIDNTMGILSAHPDVDPAEARAAAYVANIFHDTGYMAPPSQMFLDMGHPRWSQQHYDENLRPLIKDAFGARMAGNVSYLIRTHAATNIDWSDDVLGSAVRVADNVALFQSQKLPALFRHVPGNTNVLEQLGQGKIDVAKAQQLLASNLGKAKLSPLVKAQMAKGIPEVFSLTPKFMLGMLGGDILGFGWENNALTVRLGRNAEADRLQKMLDLGQRQFAKFAKTYGVDPKQFTESLQFEFKDPTGRTVLRSTIEEMKALLKMMEGWKAKGRWRTLRDGRHVHITGSMPRAYTVTRAGVKRVATERVDKIIDTIASRLNTTPEEIVADVQASIEEATDGKPITVNVPEWVARQIFDEDGRLKNQYETGKSMGMFDPRFRMDAETRTFDVTRGTVGPGGAPVGATPVRELPIYGSIHNGHGNAEQYGRVRFELKDRVRSRSTATVGDSLGQMHDGEIAPAPISRLSRDRGAWDGRMDIGALATGQWQREVSYFEVQIHGGVTLKDIARIVVPPGLGVWLPKAAKEHGIEVVVEKPSWMKSVKARAARRGKVIAVRGELEMLYRGRGDPKPNDPKAMCRIRHPDGRISGPLPVQVALKWGYWTDPPEESSKAKGRWRTLRDGRHVHITGSMPRAYTATRAGVKRRVLEDVERNIDYFSNRSGMPPDEIEEQCERSVEEAVLGHPIVVRVPEHIVPRILEDGRVKNQYETGTSKGMFNPDVRMKAETDTFDIERPDPIRTGKGTPVQEFPIYGMVGNGYERGAAYGGVRIELKDTVKSRATVTVGDSLGRMMRGKVAPSPVRNPGREAWDDYIEMLATNQWKDVAYFETQIHGGVTLKDIKRIIMPKGSGPWIKDFAAGFDVEVVYE